MGQILVIDWRDCDPDSKTGGTKLTVREGGSGGKVVHEQVYGHDELDRALTAAKRALDEASGTFVNAMPSPNRT
jgi:hypothetical protein